MSRFGICKIPLRKFFRVSYFFSSSLYRSRQDRDFCHAVRNLCFLGLERSLSIICRADLRRISREDFFSRMHRHEHVDCP